MLSSIIKVKLEKNCCPFEKLENFFAKRVFHIDDIKRFKEPSVKLVIEHGYDETLTLPREQYLILCIPLSGVEKKKNNWQNILRW